MASVARSSLGAVTSKEKKRGSVSVANSLLQALMSRTQNHGSWFVIHKSLAPHLRYSELIDIDDLFAAHPSINGGMDGFKAILLDEAQLEEQVDRIRMCSYRWENVESLEGDEHYALPSNFRFVQTRMIACCEKSIMWQI